MTNVLATYAFFSNYSFVVQNWAMLIFNATFIPMMVMSIVATTTDLAHVSRRRIAFCFAGLIFVAGNHLVP